MQYAKRQAALAPKWHRYAQFLLGMVVGSGSMVLWGQYLGIIVVLILCLLSILWGKAE